MSRPACVSPLSLPLCVRIVRRPSGGFPRVFVDRATYTRVPRTRRALARVAPRSTRVDRGLFSSLSASVASAAPSARPATMPLPHASPPPARATGDGAVAARDLLSLPPAQVLAYPYLVPAGPYEQVQFGDDAARQDRSRLLSTTRTCVTTRRTSGSISPPCTHTSYARHGDIPVLRAGGGAACEQEWDWDAVFLGVAALGCCGRSVSDLAVRSEL